MMNWWCQHPGCLYSTVPYHDKATLAKHTLVEHMTASQTLTIQNAEMARQLKVLQAVRDTHDECTFHNAATVSMLKELKELKDKVESRDRGLKACFTKLAIYRKAMVAVTAYIENIPVSYTEGPSVPVDMPEDATWTMARLLEGTPGLPMSVAYYRAFLHVVHGRLIKTMAPNISS